MDIGIKKPISYGVVKIQRDNPHTALSIVLGTQTVLDKCELLLLLPLLHCFMSYCFFIFVRFLFTWLFFFFSLHHEWITRLVMKKLIDPTSLLWRDDEGWLLILNSFRLFLVFGYFTCSIFKFPTVFVFPLNIF